MIGLGVYVALAMMIWVVALAVQVGAFQTSDPVAVPAVVLTSLVYGVPWIIALGVSARIARFAEKRLARMALFAICVGLTLEAAYLFLSQAPNAGNPIDWYAIAYKFALPCALSAVVVAIPVWWIRPDVEQVS
jgi:hypothetical protein